MWGQRSIRTRDILSVPHLYVQLIKNRPSVIWWYLYHIPLLHNCDMSPWQNAFHCRPPTRPLPAGAVMVLKGVDGIWESPVLWYGLEVREIIIWHVCDSSQILLLRNCLPSHTAGEALKAPCYIRLKWRMQHKSPEPWPWLWLNAHTGPFPWGMSWLEPINPGFFALSLTLSTWKSPR